MDKNIFNTKHTSNVRDINRIFTVQAKLLNIMPDTRDDSKVYKRYMQYLLYKLVSTVRYILLTQ